MIEASGLTKIFDDFVAVDDLSLQVEAGSVFAFLGPNGAGKTTTSAC
jgi:ABC-type multidrug transport system ATPase subunit